MTAALFPCEITHARARPIRRTFRHRSYLWLAGARRSYTPWRLLGYALRYPWVTPQVSVLIRWQGLRLAARRLPIFPRPAQDSQEGAP